MNRDAWDEVIGLGFTAFAVVVLVVVWWWFQ